MADVLLDPNAGDVILNFSFNTPQQFFYIVEVVDDQKKQFYHNTGQWNGTTSFNLGPANSLIGLNLNIYWTVIDNNGAGNPYRATAIAFQNDSPRANAQAISGSTNNSQSFILTAGKFN